MHVLSIVGCILLFVSAGSDALSVQKFPTSTNNQSPATASRRHFQCASHHHQYDDDDRQHQNSSNRRSALQQLTGCLLASPLISISPAMASPLVPDPQGITTVVLDSADMKIGVELYDVVVGSNPAQTFAAVKTVSPQGVAASETIQPGMIVLGKDASQGVIRRIQQGPYPIVLQFYNLGQVGDYQDNPISPQLALQAAQQASKDAALVKEPPLSAKGTGLIVTTVQKPTVPCNDIKNKGARRGDTLEIKYEARVASPGGPIYDSSQERFDGKSVSFVLGKGQVVNGVDIGVYDMCPGEVRTLDIPSTLGYGRAGSDVFDIPGDVRLWWKVELLSLTKGEPKLLLPSF